MLVLFYLPSALPGETPTSNSCVGTPMKELLETGWGPTDISIPILPVRTLWHLSFQLTAPLRVSEPLAFAQLSETRAEAGDAVIVR